MKKGYVKSKEWIEKIRQANKGKPSPRKGMVFVSLEVQKERKRQYKREWDKRNHDRVVKQHRAWAKANRDKINALARKRYINNRDKELARHRLASYGIDAQTYQAMVDAQNGKCLICGDKVGINLSVDHNHRTGKIRGLICNPCNISIAKAKDSPIILRAMADYLERFDV